MDPLVKNDLHSLDSIKKAMLEHEHLFKQQVKELHRLYGVQRMLMNELKSKVTLLDKTRLANAHFVKHGCVDLQQSDEEVETELTLGIGSRKYSDKGMKTRYQVQPHCNVDLLLYPKSISDQLQMISERKELSDGEERAIVYVDDCGEIVVISDQARSMVCLL